jgi:nuclease EXOG
MSATFFLSNIVPQDGNNNSGYWNQLEIFCRHLSTKYDHVYVISGPLFLPRKENVNGVTRNYVSYEVNACIFVFSVRELNLLLRVSV